MRKKLIIVTSPPACGKTHISKELSKHLNNIVYLDKDTLIPLSRQIFNVANEPFNRSSDFFEEYIRDLEYEVVIDLGMEALEYNDLVLINAPFTREIRDKEYMDNFREQLHSRGASLVVIWVKTDPEIVHERMIKRNSDRDTWKLENWDEYIAGCDFTIPTDLDTPGIKDDFLVFENNNEEEFQSSMVRITGILEEATGRSK